MHVCSVWLFNLSYPSSCFLAFGVWAWCFETCWQVNKTNASHSIRGLTTSACGIPCGLGSDSGGSVWPSQVTEPPVPHPSPLPAKAGAGLPGPFFARWWPPGSFLGWRMERGLAFGWQQREMTSFRTRSCLAESRMRIFCSTISPSPPGLTLLPIEMKSKETVAIPE